MAKRDKLQPRFFRILAVLALFCLLSPLNVYAMGVSKQKAAPDALILLIEKDYLVDPGGNYTLRLHVKTRINTYKGRKSWADFKAGYNARFEKIKVIEAKTITAKGETIPVTDKEIHDITDPSTQGASFFSASRLKVVNFPSVEEGCTVELVLEKSSRLGLWAVEPFSLNDPVGLKRVTVSLPGDQKLAYHLLSRRIQFSTKQKGERIIYRWEARNRPRLLSDPMMPPVENRNDTLIFSTLGSWNGVADFFKKRLRPRGEKSDMGKGLKIEVEADSADDLFLALKQRIEIFPIGFFKSNLRFLPPLVTFKRGYGSQMDAIILFTRLLEEKRIPFDLVAVNSAGIWMKGLKDCFNPALFNTFVVKVGRRFYSFDMKEAPPGVTGIDGELGLNLNTSRLEPVEDSPSQAASQEFYVDLLAPNSYIVDYKAYFQGLKAVSLKKTFKDLTKGEFLVRQSVYFHSLNPVAVPLSSLKVSGIEPGSAEVSIRARYKVDNFVFENHGRFFFPFQAPGMLSAFFKLPPERKSPIFIRRPLSQWVKINVKLPKGLSLQRLPENFSGSVGPFSWNYSCSISKGGLSCQKNVKVKRGFLKNGAEFTKFRKIVNKLLDPRANALTFHEVIR